MRALVIVILAVIAVSAYAGKCPSGQDSKAVDSKTTLCPQYAGDSCCQAAFYEGECTSYDGCRHSPDQCSFLQGLLSCGSQCKPDFYEKFVDMTNGNIRLCEPYYKALEDACAKITVCDRFGNRSVDCRQDSKLCQNYYTDAEDFWKNFGGGRFVSSTDTEKCFSAGFAVLPSFILVAVALIAAIMY